MSTINGKQSVFITPSAPQAAADTPATEAPATVDYATHFQNQVSDAIDFAKQLQEWLSDADAQAEYRAWSESIRPDDAERVQTDAEKRAEAHELARLEEYGIGHAFNGDDLRWQQGGN